MDNTTLIALLKNNQLRDTQPRRMVIAALEKNKKGSSPYDIQKWIAKKGNAINTVTVYRILEAFEKIGIVHKHPCSGQFTLCSLPHQKGHHGFLHCHSCGTIDEFCSEDLCKVENSIAKKARFTPSSHMSEIVGLCFACAS
ncbi:MAG: transcriptional repressor [Candidatus Peribacteraceae bacterium]|nr:transcriptional repressor [Candidatus Peribacteraceae bacterium]